MGFYLFANQDLPFEYGVCHSDEMIYLWYFPFPDPDSEELKLYRFNADEDAMARRMVKVWTNFVKYG